MPGGLIPSGILLSGVAYSPVRHSLGEGGRESSRASARDRQSGLRWQQMSFVRTSESKHDVLGRGRVDGQMCEAMSESIGRHQNKMPTLFGTSNLRAVGSENPFHKRN